jgi:hypothetical protein
MSEMLAALRGSSHTLQESVKVIHEGDEDVEEEEEEEEQQDPLPVNAPQPGNQRNCVVCLGERVAPFLIFTPCGHRRSCSTCMDTIVEMGSNCPECRSRINGRQRVYLD